MKLSDAQIHGIDKLAGGGGVWDSRTEDALVRRGLASRRETGRLVLTEAGWAVHQELLEQREAAQKRFDELIERRKAEQRMDKELRKQVAEKMGWKILEESSRPENWLGILNGEQEWVPDWTTSVDVALTLCDRLKVTIHIYANTAIVQVATQYTAEGTRDTLAALISEAWLAYKEGEKTHGE